MSVNEKKWLVMHMHVQLQLDELTRVKSGFWARQLVTVNSRGVPLISVQLFWPLMFSLFQPPPPHLPPNAGTDNMQASSQLSAAVAKTGAAAFWCCQIGPDTVQVGARARGESRALQETGYDAHHHNRWPSGPDGTNYVYSHTA